MKFQIIFGVVFLMGIIIYFLLMSIHVKWTDQIDLLLCTLYEKDGIVDWSRVSEKISAQVPGFFRTGKQCRQRYNNIAKFREQFSEWSWNELQMIVSEFISKGPKWVQISKTFPSRSHNSLKNKFNAELRKTIRRLNRIRADFLTKNRKSLESQWFTKISRIGYGSQTNKCNQMKIQAQKMIKDVVDVFFIEKYELPAHEEERIYLNLLQRISQYNKNCLFLKKVSHIKSEQGITKNSAQKNKEHAQDDGALVKKQEEPNVPREKIVKERQIPEINESDQQLEKPIEVVLRQNVNVKVGVRQLQDLSQVHFRKRSRQYQFNYFENSV